jgi:hypothetical protein
VCLSRATGERAAADGKPRRDVLFFPSLQRKSHPCPCDDVHNGYDDGKGEVLSLTLLFRFYKNCLYSAKRVLLQLALTFKGYVKLETVNGLNSAASHSKSKAIPVTGLGGLSGCERLRIPYFIDNWLKDGGKVVSPTHRPHFTPQKYYCSASGINFC